MQGKNLFMSLLSSDVPKVCVENPIPSTIYELPKHTQEIQPYHFGHPFKKATRLWLKGLKPLVPTDIIFKRAKYISRKGTKASEGATSNKKERSKTFPGIAKAMAEQWG